MIRTTLYVHVFLFYFFFMCSSVFLFSQKVIHQVDILFLFLFIQYRFFIVFFFSLTYRTQKLINKLNENRKRFVFQIN